MRTPHHARMFLPVAAAAAMLPLAAPVAAQAVPPALSLQQQTSVRCAAAFAIVADAQKRGGPGADRYPPLAERGREFFVRTVARLMDERALSREQVSTLIGEQAQALWDEGAIEAQMPACLLLLDASGL